MNISFGPQMGVAQNLRRVTQVLVFASIYLGAIFGTLFEPK